MHYKEAHYIQHVAVFVARTSRLSTTYRITNTTGVPLLALAFCNDWTANFKIFVLLSGRVDYYENVHTFYCCCNISGAMIDHVITISDSLLYPRHIIMRADRI